MLACAIRSRWICGISFRYVLFAIVVVVCIVVIIDIAVIGVIVGIVQ